MIRADADHLEGQGRRSNEKMKKPNYRLHLATTLLFTFLFGWGIVALVCGTIWSKELAFKAPLFGILPILYVGSSGFWVSLLILVTLFTSIIILFLKIKWSKLITLPIFAIAVYWVWCTVVMWAASKV